MGADAVDRVYAISRKSEGKALAFAKKMKWKETREQTAGYKPGLQFDVCNFPKRFQPTPNEYENPETEIDPASEVTHCQHSGNLQ